MATKNCSKCNRLFACDCETTGCWCEDLYIDLDTLNKLKKQFDNCLCPTCLKEYSIQQEKK